MISDAAQTSLQKAAAVISSQANKLAKLEKLLQSSKCSIAIVSLAARMPHAADDGDRKQRCDLIVSQIGKKAQGRNHQ